MFVLDVPKGIILHVFLIPLFWWCTKYTSFLSVLTLAFFIILFHIKIDEC